ncbi:nicotinate-nucleotide--dimethylbenzimidazole phosphoribosyltransferase [Bernardetia sp.]|uniref:nicotinate-nucleotide--dimethylbenzimidazole phosphoribosyltransferase n=1 Tax=Bernardetia sp. TaxID=1937974 RepID=UPI0025BF2557|nr:nicotinate-nucleotide--dimethylbenzimidazole phosphoribosyltransferase [Bernardetia sp.]
MSLSFSIPTISLGLRPDLQRKINQKTKPIGSLGRLEGVALQIGLIQQTLSPKLTNPHIVVFAGDHGIAESGVSQYPQEVTYQMVKNFLNGGAAINTFCKQNNIELIVADTGVKGDFDKELTHFLNLKISHGTKNFLEKPAMSEKECLKCIEQGSNIVKDIAKKGTNVIGFGEMGIGNTSSASFILHHLTGMKLAECVGSGTGLNEKGLEKKLAILKQANRKYPKNMKPLEVLATFGGFEIAHMVGAMLEGAEQKMVVLVDGFIATSAAMIAHALYPQAKEYMIFSHQSDEYGHAHMLEHLRVMPLLLLGMRLGEGTGCAVAYPLLKSAVNFINNMASFEDASVSETVKG